MSQVFRAKLARLSLEKSMREEQLSSSESVFKYMRQASLQHIRAGNLPTSVTHDSLIAPFRNPMVSKAPTLSESHPDLLAELNDPNAEVPAYARFQKYESTNLRPDLQKLKAEHFRRNYSKHLSMP